MTTWHKSVRRCVHPTTDHYSVSISVLRLRGTVGYKPNDPEDLARNLIVVILTGFRNAFQFGLQLARYPSDSVRLHLMATFENVLSEPTGEVPHLCIQLFGGCEGFGENFEVHVARDGSHIWGKE